MEPKCERCTVIGKLAPFESQLQLALQADTHRIKRERRTGLMHFEAKALHFPTGAQLLDYVEDIKAQLPRGEVEP